MSSAALVDTRDARSQRLLRKGIHPQRSAARETVDIETQIGSVYLPLTAKVFLCLPLYPNQSQSNQIGVIDMNFAPCA